MNRSLFIRARTSFRGTMAAVFRRQQSGHAGRYGGASYGAYGGLGADIEGSPLYRQQAPPDANPAMRKETRPVPPRERNENKKREEIEKTVAKQRHRDEEIGKDASGKIFPGGES